MADMPMLTGELSAADFLRQHWQKEPLLVRRAIPGLQSPVTPEELMELACDEQVESRLVLEKDGARPWELRHGPFTAKDFAGLPETHWTLLLQEMNKHLAEAAELVTRFEFIPSWRIDDVMISLSPPQGSVGPHVDTYDVFLLQAEGRKRWRIANGAHGKDALLDDVELRILRDFSPDQEWILGPGDMLYLPPGIAHHGTALDNGQTWSVGFRAPSQTDMLSAMVEQAMQTLDPEARYRDPGLVPPQHPAEITPDVLAQVQRQVLALTQGVDPADWFGRLVTENRSGLGPEPAEPSISAAELRSLYQQRGALERDPGARFAYVRRPAGGATLFVDGEAYLLNERSAFAAPLLSERPNLPWEDVRAAMDDESLLDALTDLYNQGCLRFVDQA